MCFERSWEGRKIRRRNRVLREVVFPHPHQKRVFFIHYAFRHLERLFAPVQTQTGLRRTTMERRNAKRRSAKLNLFLAQIFVTRFCVAVSQLRILACEAFQSGKVAIAKDCRKINKTYSIGKTLFWVGCEGTILAKKQTQMLREEFEVTLDALKSCNEDDIRQAMYFVPSVPTQNKPKSQSHRQPNGGCHFY